MPMTSNQARRRLRFIAAVQCRSVLFWRGMQPKGLAGCLNNGCFAFFFIAFYGETEKETIVFNLYVRTFRYVSSE